MKAREEIRSNHVDDVERVGFGHAILRRLCWIFSLTLFLSKSQRVGVYSCFSQILGVSAFIWRVLGYIKAKTRISNRNIATRAPRSWGLQHLSRKSRQPQNTSGKTGTATLLLAVVWRISKNNRRIFCFSSYFPTGRSPGCQERPANILHANLPSCACRTAPNVIFVAGTRAESLFFLLNLIK